MIEITIVGNVGSLRLAQAGEMPVLNVSVASSRRLGEKEYTDWVSAKIWGERAVKLQQHITKGAKLLLRGRPEAKAYQRQDGTVAGELVLHVASLEFLSAKAREVSEQQLPLGSEVKQPRRKAKN